MLAEPPGAKLITRRPPWQHYSHREHTDQYAQERADTIRTVQYNRLVPSERDSHAKLDESLQTPQNAFVLSHWYATWAATTRVLHPSLCVRDSLRAAFSEIKRLQLSRVVEKACRGNCCHTPTSGGPQQCNPPAESTAAESLQALPMAPSSPRPPQFKREHKRERHGPRI